MSRRGVAVIAPTQTVLRPGTGAATALRVLHSLAGQAERDPWCDALRRQNVNMVRQFDALINNLIAAGMVFRRARDYIITDDGLAWLGVRAGVVPRAEPTAVPTRHVPIRRQAWAHLAREGSLDFRDIPSRMGDALIPHRKA
jgi:hypothetical protein